MNYVTILDVAKARGAKFNQDGSISMGEVEATGVPAFCGCVGCGESLACYNAYPTTSGYTMCRACANDSGKGFPTTVAFEAWEAYQDELDTAETLQGVLDQLAYALVEYGDIGVCKYAEAADIVRNSNTWEAYVARFREGDGSLIETDLVDAIVAEQKKG